jgi:hypothetical protein
MLKKKAGVGLWGVPRVAACASTAHTFENGLASFEVGPCSVTPDSL